MRYKFLWELVIHFHYVFKNEGITVSTAVLTFIWGDWDGRVRGRELLCAGSKKDVSVPSSRYIICHAWTLFYQGPSSTAESAWLFLWQERVMIECEVRGSSGAFLWPNPGRLAYYLPANVVTLSRWWRRSHPGPWGVRSRALQVAFGEVDPTRWQSPFFLRVCWPVLPTLSSLL